MILRAAALAKRTSAPWRMKMAQGASSANVRNPASPRRALGRSSERPAANDLRAELPADREGICLFVVAVLFVVAIRLDQTLRRRRNVPLQQDSGQGATGTRVASRERDASLQF